MTAGASTPRGRFLALAASVLAVTGSAAGASPASAAITPSAPISASAASTASAASAAPPASAASPAGAVAAASAAAPAGAAPPASAASPASAAAFDPNAFALINRVEAPCAAPCMKQGVVYDTTTSALNAAAGQQQLHLDLYRSAKTPTKNARVVVLLHGGGFVEGDESQMRPMAEALANAGFLVASIQYRLVDPKRNKGAGIAAEDDLIPASAEAEQDAERALRWIRARATKLGAARAHDQYFVGGYSAGAIASLRVAVRGGDKSTPASRRFKIGGAFAISGFECGAWTKAAHCNARYDPADAPILIFHGDGDTVVPFEYGESTCQSAVLQGGGCTGYFYDNQDHFWKNGILFGGAKGGTKREPAVVPTIAKWIRSKA